jgi:hypothetical protein
MAVQRDQGSALIDVQFGNAWRAGKRLVVTSHGFGRAVEPSEKTAAFVQGVNVIGIERENRFIGRQRPIELLQALERAGSVSERREIVGAERKRFLKMAQRLLVPRQRGKDQAIVVEQLGGARSTRQDCAHELQRLDIPSLLMTDETEQMPCVALTGLARKNVAKNALGLGELSALPQGQRLLD